ncbi:hypothetical protein ASPSYDRAFT_211502 [Aspergillus sydowii CBS 593.65]|uniref:Major facilitator superfamily (MFS) profile domain-containing protein n=1 Tax=Aspergillus sydowii CBS 593.65 TaxID=1036612 RepID=A0A1L9T2Q9_9EURO|nr:uncharacterized protein ASPSYDRAFT_211502 [Aspergillus sydowii CBS 593.65]OJJ53730.1 hypothetical protein ASPSYDRAFT_211502 [Aspergillus sydowii CBS 593.65]
MDPALTSSPFGLAVHLLSGGRLFTPTEYRPDFTFPGDGSIEKHTHERVQEGIEESTQATQEPILVDWYGPDDPDNPHNWPFAVKLLVYITVNWLTFIVYMSATVFSMAEDDFQAALGTTRTTTALGLALYVLGYAIGPLIWSPLSEIPSVGRNPPYLVSTACFLLISIGTALANSVPAFLVLRFLQGFFGSPSLGTGGASLADVTGPRNLPYAMCIWGLCAVAGPAIAPIISGFSVPVKGWQWSMWEIVWAAAPCCIMLVFLPETSSLAILHQRARRLRKRTGNDNFHTVAETRQKASSPLHIAYNALVVPWEINALDPAILFTTIYLGLVYAIFYSFFESLPLVYLGIHHMSLSQLGLIFLACLIGALVTLPFYLTFIHSVLNRSSAHPPEPETRLIPALFGSVLIPAGLFIFAWTARDSTSWPVPTAGLLIEMAGTTLVIQCTLSYLSVAYPRYSASIFAMNDLARAGLAFGAILWSGPLYDGLGIAWATTLLACLTVGCTVGMFVLYWFGGTLRKRSRFAED